MDWSNFPHDAIVQNEVIKEDVVNVLQEEVVLALVVSKNFEVSQQEGFVSKEDTEDKVYSVGRSKLDVSRRSVVDNSKIANPVKDKETQTSNNGRILVDVVKKAAVYAKDQTDKANKATMANVFEVRTVAV